LWLGKYAIRSDARWCAKVSGMEIFRENIGKHTIRHQPLLESVVCSLRHAGKSGVPGGWTSICQLSLDGESQPSDIKNRIGICTDHQRAARTLAGAPHIRWDQGLRMMLLHACAVSLQCVQLRQKMHEMSRRVPHRNDKQYRWI